MSTPELRDGKPLQIAAVSDLLQIPVPTIRSWERRYGFPAPARTRGRHRRYSSEEVEQLRALRDAITHGYAAKEAVEVVRKGRVGPTAGAPRVDALLRTAMDLDPNGARAVLGEAADSLGVEAAVIDVMLPAMQEVGARWKAGTCDAANEHLLTDAVRNVACPDGDVDHPRLADRIGRARMRAEGSPHRRPRGLRLVARAQRPIRGDARRAHPTRVAAQGDRRHARFGSRGGCTDAA